MSFVTILYLVTALAYGGFASKLIVSWRNLRLVAAVASTALWAATVAFELPAQDIVWFCAAAAWAGVVDDLERKFVETGRPRRLGIARITSFAAFALAVVSGLSVVLPVLALQAALAETRLVLALAILIACENVYRNAEHDMRWHLTLPLVGISTMQICTMLLYATGVLHGRLSFAMFEAQASIYLMVLPLFAATERRLQHWRRGVALSHEAVFYTASLVLGGSFLLGLGVVGTLLRHYGPSWGAVVQIALLFFGLVVIATLAGSGSARSRLRQLLVKNFFTQRYDYRREWLRCIETLGAIDRAGLAQRFIKVVADTVDSPAGVLLLRDENAEGLALVVDGEWNMRAPVRRVPHGHRLLEHLGTEPFRLISAEDNLDFPSSPPAWLIVTLPDPRGMTPLGIVVAAAPRAGAALDGEATALLAVVAREISLMVAERRAAEALNEARRFLAAGQRFAFVAHDIKNVANQLALLVDNAGHHMTDVEFQADMMLTLRSSVAKIQSMLARLKAPDELPGRLEVEIRLSGLASLAWARARVPVELSLTGQPAVIAMPENAFDAVLNHLVENAIDASSCQPVIVAVQRKKESLGIAITDRGVGMSEAFIHDELFNPFVSSKAGGLGIGAFQARELVQAAGGSMAVESAIGLGTTVFLEFPVLETRETPIASQEAP